ncbi:unnamed protein product [Cuscuta campestris]|uniref:Uncharacterized protein n=1 Tax=Cuscuta campestris TaxID=132261 RepID=A0A484N6N0_9ASTE|nr:unnamed protein product [Cuscuta campestris]
MEDSWLIIPGEGKGIGSKVILGEGKLRFLNQAGGGQQVGLVLCPGEKAKIHRCQLLVSGYHRILVFPVTVLVL